MFNSLRIHTLIALILLSGRELKRLWSPRDYTKTPGNILANLYDKSNQYVYVVCTTQQHNYSVNSTCFGFSKIIWFFVDSTFNVFEKRVWNDTLHKITSIAINTKRAAHTILYVSKFIANTHTNYFLKFEIFVCCFIWILFFITLCVVMGWICITLPWKNKHCTQ